MYAQEDRQGGRVDLRLDLVGIVARDMRASLEFYRTSRPGHPGGRRGRAARRGDDTVRACASRGTPPSSYGGSTPSGPNPQGDTAWRSPSSAPTPRVSTRSTRNSPPSASGTKTPGTRSGDSGTLPSMTLTATRSTSSRRSRVTCWLRAGSPDASLPLLSVLALRHRRAGARTCRRPPLPLPQDLRRTPRLA